MARFRDLAPQVQPEAQECPLAIIENETRKTARDFCERSTYWRYEHPAIDTGNDTGEYDLTIPEGAQIVSVLSPARHRREIIVQLTKNDLDLSLPDWESRTNIQAQWFRMILPTRLRLVPYPTADEAVDAALKVTVALKPAKDAEEIDDYVFDDWYEVLASGVLARLFARQGTAYYKPELVPVHGALYDDGVRRAQEKAVSEFTTTFADRDHRVEPHFF